jgi:hypothetical protein
LKPKSAPGKSVFRDRGRGGLIKNHQEQLALTLLKNRLTESVRVRKTSLSLAISLEN